MVHWNSSPHPISDIRDWNQNGRLELQPDFQRREVWSLTARIMLMDTIIRDVPMPKVFLASELRDDKTYRIVIDGQQRISTILCFLRDEFALDSPYQGEGQGKKFSDLDEQTRAKILNYKIDFNEAINPTEEEVREVYTRVNKYTVPLTKQELRRADFPGDFLNESEKLASLRFFDDARIFTAANLRRYGDVEYISELLAAVIGGIQDKREMLDDYYIQYANWDDDEKNEIVNLFESTLKEIELIFDDSFKISTTRFKQKADFYSLFLVVKSYLQEGASLAGKDIEPLREDLRTLDYFIRPESQIEICSEYAIKCVSQANSASSRRWRYVFMSAIMHGAFKFSVPEEEKRIVLYSLKDQLEHAAIDPMCPDPVHECPICGRENISGYFNDCFLAWDLQSDVFQLSNSYWIHESCLESLNPKYWIALSRPEVDSEHGELGEQSSLF